MISTAIAPNDMSMADALWTLITPLKRNVRELLAMRLNESLLVDVQTKVDSSTSDMSKAMDFVKTLSAKGTREVPNYINGIETLIDEKYAL